MLGDNHSSAEDLEATVGARRPLEDTLEALKASISNVGDVFCAVALPSDLLDPLRPTRSGRSLNNFSTDGDSARLENGRVPCPRSLGSSGSAQKPLKTWNLLRPASVYRS